MRLFMTKQVDVILLVTLVVSLSSGCTYEGVQEYAQRECYKMTEPDRSYCLEGTRDDYDTYMKKREALIKGQK